MSSRSEARVRVLAAHLSTRIGHDEDEYGASGSGTVAAPELTPEMVSGQADDVAESESEGTSCAVASPLTASPVWGSGVEATQGAKQRAVIVCGVRTPFVKAFGQLEELDNIGLGVSVVQGLLEKTKLDAKNVDEIIWGAVVMNSAAPNPAREIALDLHLPATVNGFTVSRACLSGLQAVITAVEMIEHGDAQCVIAGGGDSMSSAEMTMPRQFVQALAKFGQAKAKNFAAIKKFFQQAGSPLTWMPQAPSITERSTGRTMGYHADLMALINSIPRQAQDSFALASHRNAAAAQKQGLLAEEVVPVSKRGGKTVTKDDLIREPTSETPDKMSKLGTVFRKSNAGGTITAASSSPLTDGASAVLIMSEEKARALGYPTDCVFRSFCITGVDPFPQLLLAPALAIPQALDDAGLTIDDIDVFEIHEAFAAQVLSTIEVLKSEEFCRKRLGRSKPVGTIPLSKVNPHGSSIAVGHPFAATGGRLVTAAVNELRRTGKRFALLSICAAGGLGGVAIIERRETA